LWIEKGLAILTDAQIAETHRAARAELAAYVARNRGDPTLGGRLVLDAVTMHDSELARVLRTLKP
jgi:hypothetical protein